MQKSVWLYITGLSIVLLMSGCGNVQNNTSDNTNSNFAVSGTITGMVAPSAVVNGVQGQADYVYAVNTAPQHGDVWRKKAPIAEDGSFEIDLSKGDPWVLAFIDTSQVGADMIQAIFRAEMLDSIAPRLETQSDSVTLGELEISGSGEAQLATASYLTFIGNLGMTEDEAEILGQMDDLMLRYINPDINGNGQLDMDEGLYIDASFGLQYKYEGEALLTNNILQGIDLPVNGNIVFLKSQAGLRMFDTPLSQGFTEAPAKWTLTWTNPGNITGIEESTTNAQLVGNTVTFTGGNLGGGGSFSDTYMDLGVNFLGSTTDVPDGTYTFQLFDNPAGEPLQTYTFTNVKTPADTTDVLNFVFPFPIFVTDAQDNITEIQYEWRRYNGTSFVPATPAELERFVGKNEAEIKWYEDEEGNGIYLVLKPWRSSFAASGTILYGNSDNCFIDPGMTGKRSAIKSVEISFVSKLGMWTKLIIN